MVDVVDLCESWMIFAGSITYLLEGPGFLSEERLKSIGTFSLREVEDGGETTLSLQHVQYNMVMSLIIFQHQTCF